MSIRRDKFSMGVYYNNQEYTPKQVAEYIAQTSGEGFADPQKLQDLIKKSQETFEGIMEEHNLTMEQILQAETSPAGKKLAELTLKHCDKTIRLIQEGGWSKGVLI